MGSSWAVEGPTTYCVGQFVGNMGVFPAELESFSWLDELFDYGIFSHQS